MTKTVLFLGEFRHFDYGIGNLDIYNEPTPASYNLSKVSVPVGIFYGKNDLIVSKTVSIPTIWE